MAEAAILKIENVLHTTFEPIDQFTYILGDCCLCGVEVSPALNLVYLLKSNMAAVAILEIVDMP